jgi:hypothetical protein
VGLLTDFFIATRAEVLAFDMSKSPSDHFPTHQMKGIDPIKVATLHTILVGADIDDTEGVVARVPPDIRHLGEGEVSIFEVPREVVHGLAGLTPSRAAEVGEAWLATEEFEGADWESSEFDAWFKEFREFMAGAVRADKPVFLWMCV